MSTPHRTADRSNSQRRDEAVHPRSAAKVNYVFARPQIRQVEEMSDAREGIDRLLRHPVEIEWGIASRSAIARPISK
jgi:hypothetical protein